MTHGVVMGGYGASDEGRERAVVTDMTASGLPYRADFLQRGGEACGLAGYPHPVEPRARAGEKADLARRNAKRRRNKPDERRIGLALARRRAHAHFQHAASVGQLRDPVDGIAATAGREPDQDEEAVRLDAPRRLAHSGEYLNVQPDDKLIEKHEADDENDW
jgi:hypothetical protein